MLCNQAIGFNYVGITSPAEPADMQALTDIFIKCCMVSFPNLK